MLNDNEFSTEQDSKFSNKKMNVNNSGIDYFLNNIEKKYNIKIIKELSKGGYGRVFLIKLRNGTEAAMKTSYISKRNYTNQDNLEKKMKIVTSEGLFATNIKYKHIIKSIATIREENNEGILFGIIMEYAIHSNLTIITQCLSKTNMYSSLIYNQYYNNLFSYLNENIIIFFTLQALFGLEFLNRSCIVHFDIKPENLLVTSGFFVKITDLGLAKSIDLSKKNYIKLSKSTKGYMGPEFFSNSMLIPNSLASKVDLFSFGCTIYFMLYCKVIPQNKVEKNLFDTIFDKILRTNYISKEMKNFIIRLLQPLDKRLNIFQAIDFLYEMSKLWEIKDIYHINECEQTKLTLEFQKERKNQKKKNKKIKNKRLVI